jgi:DNA-binding NtrC family response regulator
MSRILIVDDDREICDFLKVILDQNQHSFLTANSVVAAKELLDQEKVDLLLLDLYLPDGTGLQLLSDLQRNGTNVPPAIIMTAFGSWETHVKAYNMGAFYYLDKPFRITQLKILVDQALAQKALQ